MTCYSGACWTPSSNPFLFPLPQVLFMILIYSQLFKIVRVFTTSESSTINWAASPSSWAKPPARYWYNWYHSGLWGWWTIILFNSGVVLTPPPLPTPSLLRRDVLFIDQCDWWVKKLRLGDGFRIWIVAACWVWWLVWAALGRSESSSRQFCEYILHSCP